MRRASSGSTRRRARRCDAAHRMARGALRRRVGPRRGRADRAAPPAPTRPPPPRGERATGGAGLAPLDPVRTVHVGTVNQASDAGLYVALEKGYFAELGLKVELVTFTNAATMIAPLGGGQPDVGGGAVSAGLWNAELRKVGIRAVADKGSTRAGWSYFGLVTRRDGPVQRCEDLKGKAISNASLSNGVLHSIELWLAKCGLTPAELGTKPLGSPDVTPALVNGGIAAGRLAR